MNLTIRLMIVAMGTFASIQKGTALVQEEIVPFWVLEVKKKTKKTKIFVQG